MTSFMRTSWLVSGVNGSLIEQSPDIGHIVAGPKSRNLLRCLSLRIKFPALCRSCRQISKPLASVQRAPLHRRSSLVPVWMGARRSSKHSMSWTVQSGG